MIVVWREFYSLAPVIVLVAVHGMITAVILGEIQPFHLLPSIWTATVIAVFGIVYWARTFSHHLVRTFGEGGVGLLRRPDTWRGYLREFWPVERLLGGMVVVALHWLFSHSFHEIKTEIPRLAGFRFDRLFADLDRMLHFGVDPWRITHGLLPSGAWVIAIDRMYLFGWMLMMISALFWYAFSRPSAGRLQFLLAFFATWMLLGNVLAVLLSSAGPVFFEPVVGDVTFVSLTSRIESIHAQTPLLAVEARDYLWAAHVAGESQANGGISAMPSMHVAVAFLVFLAVRNRGPLPAIAGAMYVGIILFSSVHLGWHYAIDGYFSIMATAVVWFASGAFARWWMRAAPPSGPAIAARSTSTASAGAPARLVSVSSSVLEEVH